MLVPKSLGFELFLVVFFVDLLEDVLEPAIITLHDCVLGAHVHGVLSLEGILEAGVCESKNGLVCVVHAHENSWTLEFVDLNVFLWSATSWLEVHRECSWFPRYEILCLILITKGMSSNNDWLGPSWYQFRNVINENWLSKHSSIQLVSNGAIWTLPHLFELELLDSCLIWCDCGALNTNFVFFNGVGTIEGNLIICLISLLDTEVKVLDVDVEIWEDEQILDLMPNDACHFITVHFDNWLINLDLLSWNI